MPKKLLLPLYHVPHLTLNHLLTLARRNLKRNNRLPMLKRLINPKKALPIKLHNIIHFQLRHITIRQRLRHRLGILVQKVLERVFRLELIFRDQVVEVDELDRDQVLVGAQPRYFFGRLFHVALEVELEFEPCDGFQPRGLGERVDGVADFAHDGVAPVHEGDFFVLRKGLRVGLLQEDGGTEDYLFVAEIVFGVLGLVLCDYALARSDDGDGYFGVFVDGGVACCGGINVFLVGGPEAVPVEIDNVL